MLSLSIKPWDTFHGSLETSSLWLRLSKVIFFKNFFTYLSIYLFIYLFISINLTLFFFSSFFFWYVVYSFAQIEFEESLVITDYKGNEQGHLQVNKKFLSSLY